MGSLLRKALVRPYFNAGVPDGFIISNIRSGSLYQKMGIMNGDIIQEVNSRKIQTADDVMGLLSTMKGRLQLVCDDQPPGEQGDTELSVSIRKNGGQGKWGVIPLFSGRCHYV